MRPCRTPCPTRVRAQGGAPSPLRAFLFFRARAPPLHPPFPAQYTPAAFFYLIVALISMCCWAKGNGKRKEWEDSEMESAALMSGEAIPENDADERDRDLGTAILTSVKGLGTTIAGTTKAVVSDFKRAARASDD